MSYCPRWLDAARASGDAYVALRDKQYWRLTLGDLALVRDALRLIDPEPPIAAIAQHIRNNVADLRLWLSHHEAQRYPAHNLFVYAVRDAALRDIPGGDFEAEYSLGAANQHYLSMVLIAAVTPSERYR